MDSKNNIDKNKLLDLHIATLNNIQTIITRLSNIGYTLISIAIGFCSILVPIIFTINLQKINKLILAVFLLFVLMLFFSFHLSNLKNERIFRKIYNDKTKIDIYSLESKNLCESICEIPFQKIKEKNKNNLTKLKCLWSITSIPWIILILVPIVSIIIILFL